MSCNNLVYGRRPVLEVIENGNVEVNKIWISDTLQDKSFREQIILFAKKRKIPYFLVHTKKLNNLCKGKNHQGIILSISPIKYLSVNELIESVLQTQSSSVILVAHEIEDVHNLGALVRTFVGAGGKGVILTGRKNIGINATAIKTSAGAIFQAQFARLTNCNQVIEKLKENSFWVVGTDISEKADLVYKIDFPDKVAIVVGNEHEGLGELIKKNCDFLARVPASKKIESLNVSVAFGIVLYEFIRQKNFNSD